MSNNYIDPRQRSPSTSSSSDTVFQEACEIYFRHCHNKPYGFFNADLFHQKAARNQIPLHLRLALIATATRYSSCSQWRDRKQSTIDGYARCSWELIVSSQDGLDGSDDMTTIQSLALLAVIDATAGRRRGAWVKIGMAVRISQDLQLMLEPSSHLPAWERDERRNLFWSLYLLDRFVCCSFQRPPAIKDTDCLLNLPSYGDLGKRERALTLKGLLLKGGARDTSVQPGMFGISIALVSVLGRTIRYMMNAENDTEKPWRSGSEYQRIYRDLEYLKVLAVNNSPASTNRAQQPRTRSQMQDCDRERVAHMVLAHTLYHLAHCILSHPYLLGLKMRSAGSAHAPRGWLRDSRAVCVVHAGALITVLVEAKAAGYMPLPSVYSYCILVAGTIQALHLTSDDANLSQSSAGYLKASLDYLGDISELWTNAHVMVNALKLFSRQCTRYSTLLLRDHPLVDELTPTETAICRSVLDYWAMMDPQNPAFAFDHNHQQDEPANSKADADVDLELLDSSDRQSSLSPSTPDSAGVITLGVAMPQMPVSEHKGLYDAVVSDPDPDPDILIQWPVSPMSPLLVEDESSPRWDWDSELNAMND
ncbi:Fungal specific transcription factor [Penicillium ucsense]|uniref:Fungal specific transcription factor n=1 Tax=Penicillium ucsense TaxID=2839758 RepID=A0A8J8W8R4_9EURO|nr:Fungal specific transcription factor [Penicillium ucsense]KAF7735374.1 Fungal specific transcription factor [Penicillium ucsense]